MMRVVGVLAVVAALLAGACGPGGRTDAADGWSCPAEWVFHALGGCGPAVLLCVPGGGAAPGACDGRDISVRRSVVLPDGATVTPFYFRPDGAPGGAWREPGEPGGPPAADWSPDAGPAARDDAWSPEAGISSCLPGWRRGADGTCDPMFETNCGSPAAALPGGGCTRTAMVDCPASEYADPGPAAVGATVVHVRAGADPVGADGSIARPLASIAAGIGAAGAGGWVLVAAGTYRESVAPAMDTHVIGVCAASVRIEPVTGAGLRVAGVRAELRGVSIAGGDNGVHADGAADVRVESVVVDGARGTSLLAAGAGTRLAGSDLVVRNGATNAAGNLGWGMAVLPGARVDVSRSVLVANRGVGVVVTGTTTSLALSTSVIRDTAAGNDVAGRGLVVQVGAVARVDGCVIDNNRDYGLAVTAAGSMCTATDVVVRATQARRDGTTGVGIVADNGSTLRAVRTLVDGNAAAGVVVRRGASVELQNSMVRDTRGQPDGGLGLGIDVNAAGRATVRATIVTNNRLFGVSSQGAGSEVTVDDSRVEHTAAGTSIVTSGLYALGGARLTASRTLVSENTEFGAFADGSGTSLVIREAWVRRTAPTIRTFSGVGIQVQGMAELTLASSVLDGNHAAGVAVTNATAQVSDVIVRNTNANGDGLFGFGLSVPQGGNVVAERVLFAGNTQAGIVVSGTGAAVVLRDALIRDTRARLDGRAGRGIDVSLVGRLEAERITVVDNLDVGVFGGGAGVTLSLRDTVVQGTRPPPGVGSGRGMSFRQGAQADLLRVLIRDNTDYGLVVDEASTRVTADDLSIASTRTFRDESGIGAYAANGARLELTRAWISNANESGVAAREQGTHVELRDVLITDVVPSGAGFGSGVLLAVGSAGTLDRVGVARVAAAGLAVVAQSDAAVNATRAASHADVHDLFVAGVRSSSLRLDTSQMPYRPAGATVSYGLHVGSGCRATVERAVLLDGGFGFFASGATFTLRHARIARQLDAEGAVSRSSMRDAVVLDDIDGQQNAAGVRYDAELPEGTALPPPTPVCGGDGC